MVMKVLAVASGGGHWDELMILKPVFDDHSTLFVTTNRDILGVAPGSVRIISDCNKNRPLSAMKCAVQSFLLVLATRPDCVISTGAAPGLLTLAFGKLFGAKTIWIDTIASARTLSLSGRIARYLADLHLTQWEHLADGKRTQYFGSIL